jgi:hypothetical protein
MKRPLSNWAKTMIVLCVLLFLMINPITRQVIVLILPLGSGIDDLIFFILLFVTVTVFLIRGAQLDKVKEWLINWFSK